MGACVLVALLLLLIQLVSALDGFIFYKKHIDTDVGSNCDTVSQHNQNY